MAKLGNDNSGNFDYLSVFDGKLVQRVPEGTEGAISRALTKGANEGKIVWEKTYSSIEGLITGAEVAVKEFSGKKIREIQVMFDDDFILQIPMSLLSHFVKPLPNVDVSKPVSLRVYKNAKGRAGLNIKQNGEDCQWAFTRENPNGLPEATKDDLGDWDFKAHDAFLIKKVSELLPAMPDLEKKEEAPTGSTNEEAPYDDDDTIPF